MNSEKNYLFMQQGLEKTAIEYGSLTDRYFKDSSIENTNYSYDNDFIPPTSWMEISLSAIDHNVHAIQSHVGGDVNVMAILKSDAYGHGLIPIAERVFEAGATKVGVNDAEEVKKIRQAGITDPVVCLYPPSYHELASLISNEAEITVDNLFMVRKIAEIAREYGKNPKLHIEVETGMHRFGIDPEQVLPIVQQIQKIENVSLEGIFTHFATAGDDSEFVDEQMVRFLDVLRILSHNNITIPSIHVANSAAIDLYPETWSPATYGAIMPSSRIMVRPGGLIYGFDSESLTELKLKTAITDVVTHITHVKNVPSKKSVGYCRATKVDQDTPIAVVPVGWGNAGYLINNGEALIKGKKVATLGYISSSALQLYNPDNACVGEKIHLVGKQRDQEITLKSLAEQNGMILNQLVSLLAAKMTRVYYENQELPVSTKEFSIYNSLAQ